MSTNICTSLVSEVVTIVVATQLAVVEQFIYASNNAIPPQYIASFDGN